MAQPDNQIPENWDELSHLMNPDVSVSPQNHFDDVAVAEQPVKVEPQKTPEPVKQPVKQAQSHASTASANSALSEAFLKGLGVKTELQNALNTPELWFEMGQSLNLLLNELMESLRQRALVKNQLRLNQTMFQTKQNNPIKFSADIDDVIQNLFIRNSASFLSSRESIKESFTDTRRHEHALLAGADGVLKGILEQVSPQQITQQVNENSNVLKIIPGQSEAKCWKIYQSLHEELAHDVNAKGAMALSDDFLKAYNDKTQETF
jgi:type VI secretion system protein ImpI